MSPQAVLAEAMSAHRNGNLAEAERLYAVALAAEPDNFDACHGLGLVRSRQGRAAEAVDLIGAALAINPAAPEALTNYGNALRAAGRLDEAMASYDRALQIKPGLAEALFNRGNLLRDLHRPADALADYDRALAINPGFAAAWNNRGNALRELNRWDLALASYGRALGLRPDHPESLNNRGVALGELRRFGEALASCDRALALRPDFAEALNTRGTILTSLNRLREAADSYERALALDPRHPHALNGLASAALNLCDWKRTEPLAERIKHEIENGAAIIHPFLLLGYSGEPALQEACAAKYLRQQVRASPAPLWNGELYSHKKIRLAYLSADFRNSAAAYLMAELFERHDRNRFEVTAISFGPDDGSAMRARLAGAFDRFEDVRARSDHDAALLLRERKIDIGIDLMGYTLDARPGILAHRPCPVQASYLGYPATMAADFIDYVIADRTVLPEIAAPLFREKIVRLARGYYPFNSTIAISQATQTRTAHGLPEQGMVFCCFNNSWKITAPMFDVWMRLLAGVPGSVLWLLAANTGAMEHLRRAAADRGIEPGRLVFAGRQEPEQHLARHRLADLFVDTLPYNAHTTASDALCAGLPVVTATGKSFSSRVAASLLEAAGLPELVTGNLQDYEALVLNLANDRALLGSIRAKLARNRGNSPLFDAGQFRRELEGAYTRMWEISHAGERPRGFGIGD